VRDERWRYLRYVDGSEELYDLTIDPNEWKNLAALPEHAATKGRMAKALPENPVPTTAPSAAKKKKKKS
jgi:choline-sulfatase